MARGTAVLASTATAIPEVCADAALLVDPRDEAQVRDGMRRILLDDALRSWLVRRGAEQVDRFTPVRTGLALRTALAGASEAVRQPVP